VTYFVFELYVLCLNCIFLFSEKIQETLGMFYSPARPLTEATILRYRDAVGHLARRFFHLLLRWVFIFWLQCTEICNQIRVL